MADVKWIKITTDMFDNAKIKYLRSLPEGNNIVLIWVMLLTKAGICNAGGMIFLAENIPYTTAMLANELGFGEDTVRLAITMLSKLGMVHAEDVLTITNWDVYQNSEGLEKVREQTRARVAKHREKHKAIGCNVTSNATVTLSNATDIEIDIDKEIEKERTDTKVSARKKESTNSSYETILSESGLDESVIPVVWDFIKMRKLIKSPLTDKALSMMINKLMKMDSTPDGQIAILEQSVMNSWKGIFHVQQDKRQGRKSSYEFEMEELSRKMDEWGIGNDQE